MSDHNDKSNIIQFPTGRARASASKSKKSKSSVSSKSESQDQLDLAQELIDKALVASGKERIKLAKEALATYEDCVDAYMLIAEAEKDGAKRIEIYRKAVAAGERALGSGWEQRYKGGCWAAPQTRPVMRAMARLAMDLQVEHKLTEAMTWYKKCLVLNPDDNQGIRYQMVGCLYQAELFDELENVLADYDDDPSADLQYMKALLAFRKNGPTKHASKALLEAYEANMFVPMFLSNAVEMPSVPPSHIGFGDASEGVAYVFDHGDLWWDTAGATTWMADTLAPWLTKADDKKLAESVLKGLRGEKDA